MICAVPASQLRIVIVHLSSSSAPTAEDNPTSTTLAPSGLASGPASAVMGPSLADVARSAASLPAGASNQLNLPLNANLGVHHPDNLPRGATRQYGKLPLSMPQFGALHEAAPPPHFQFNTASSAARTSGGPFLPVESKLNPEAWKGANNNIADWYAAKVLSAHEIVSTDQVRIFCVYGLGLKIYGSGFRAQCFKRAFARAFPVTRCFRAPISFVSDMFFCKPLVLPPPPVSRTLNPHPSTLNPCP